MLCVFVCVCAFEQWGGGGGGGGDLGVGWVEVGSSKEDSRVEQNLKKGR